MDLLVKYVTGRNLILLLLLGIGLRGAMGFGHLGTLWYMRWRYPPQGGPAPQGLEILAENEKRAAHRMEARYRRLLAQLGQARAEGFDVTSLENKARAAMTLNVAAYRRQGAGILNDIEMALPRKPARYRPIGPAAAPEEDIEPDVAAAKATPRNRRRR